MDAFGKITKLKVFSFKECKQLWAKNLILASLNKVVEIMAILLAIKMACRRMY